ncbi:MAG: hypothetical protein WBB67_01025 [bacterium]
MKKFYYLLPLIIFCIVSCRERTNVFDILDEDFMAPPHIWDTWVSGVYYDPYGYLVGVRMQIDFTDRFEKALPLYNEFYQDVSLRTEVQVDAGIGTITYSVEIFGPYEVGDYCLKIYFGEMPIGACRFDVISDDGRLTIQNVSTYTMDLPKPICWYCSVHL